MFSWFRKSPGPAEFDAPIAPGSPFAVIGDIHGSAGLLRQILQHLETETTGPVVSVGDYIDRGENSAAVLDILMDRQSRDPENTICLMGNHEAMLLEFLDSPTTAGLRWMRHGGRQTLASFGLQSPVFDAPHDDWISLRDGFADRLGPDRLDWLRGLPLYWQSGNVVVAHAAADPSLPLDRQSAQSLLWGHPDFLRRPRQDGLWIAHGHTIVDKPTAEHGRIATDTGAYATGRLTAAWITTGDIHFTCT